MHGYCFDKEKLKRKLKEFKKGQFLMETKEGLVFRGEIKECVIPDERYRKISMSFNWLCERIFILDALWEPVPTWVRLEPPIGSSHLDVEFSSYYIQHDEERLKMWSTFSEKCHFFKWKDLTNLVLIGDKFTRRWFLPRHTLRRKIIIALLNA